MTSTGRSGSNDGSRKSAAVASALAGAATGQRVVRVERLWGGLANTMVVAILDTGERVVVRLPRGRPPDWLAIEAAVMRRAAAVVPVPEVLLVDVEGSIGGRPGMVMTFVDGYPGRPMAKRVDEDGARSLGREFGTVLGALADIEFERAGYFTDPTLAPVAIEPPDIVELLVSSAHRSPRPHPVHNKLRAAWDGICRDRPELLQAVSAKPALVHGDANANNFLVGPSAGGRLEVKALVDWEYALAGSPLVDLGAILRAASRRPPSFSTGMIEAYEHRAGRLPDGWRGAATIIADLQIWEFACFARHTPMSPLLRLLARKGAIG